MFRVRLRVRLVVRRRLPPAVVFIENSRSAQSQPRSAGWSDGYRAKPWEMARPLERKQRTEGISHDLAWTPKLGENPCGMGAVRPSTINKNHKKKPVRYGKENGLELVPVTVHASRCDQSLHW